MADIYGTVDFTEKELTYLRGLIAQKQLASTCAWAGCLDDKQKEFYTATAKLCSVIATKLEQPFINDTSMDEGE